MTTPKPGTMAQLRALPGVRWEVADTPAGDGFVWLRPRVTAVRAPVSEVEAWDIDEQTRREHHARRDHDRGICAGPGGCRWCDGRGA